MLNWWMDEWMRMAKAVRFALDWNHWAKCVCWFSRLIKASEIVSVGFSNEILKDWPRDWEKNVQKSNGRKCCFQMHRTLIRGVGCARVRISGMQYSAGAKKNRQIEIMRNVAQISNESALDSNRDLIIDSLWHRFFLWCEVNENRLWLFTIFKPCSVKPNHYTINSNYDFIYISSFSSYHLTFDGY